MKNICIIFLLSIIFALSGCSKMNSEIVPIEDGLYFRYQTITNGKYEIVEEEKFSKRQDEKWLLQKKEIKMREKGDNWMISNRGYRTINVIDIDGRKIDLKDALLIAPYINHWLPVRYREQGAIFDEIRSDRLKKLHSESSKLVVTQKQHWKNWDVWLVKSKAGDHFYYEVNTGWLVGHHNSEYKKELIDTNVKIPISYEE